LRYPVLARPDDFVGQVVNLRPIVNRPAAGLLVISVDQGRNTVCGLPYAGQDAILWGGRQPPLSEYSARLVKNLFMQECLSSLAMEACPGAGKWQREQTAAEPLRGRTATSMLFLSALKQACW
jgi:hypothetical protein